MGEAKRRKQQDPNYGKEKRAYLTDTYNLFRIEYQDGRTWLVTNLTLEEKGFNSLPDNWNDAIERQLQVSLGVVKPSKQCWVLIEDTVLPNDIIIGKLSHHPAHAMTKGFATLTVERHLTPPNAHNSSQRP